MIILSIREIVALGYLVLGMMCEGMYVSSFLEIVTCLVTQTTKAGGAMSQSVSRSIANQSR